jgi:Uncharacterized protein conserved in bacteria (DUF2332)
MSVADWWLHFAKNEAAGRSPLYEEIARGVARDEELIALLSPLFQAERQPNLLLASVRYLGGTGSSFSDFRSFVLDHRDEVLISCTPDGRRQMRLVAVRSCSPRLRSCLGRSPCSRWEPAPASVSFLTGSAIATEARAAGDPSSPVQLPCEVQGRVECPTNSPRLFGVAASI